MSEIHDILEESEIGSELSIEYVSIEILTGSRGITGRASEAKTTTLTIAQTPKTYTPQTRDSSEPTAVLPY